MRGRLAMCLMMAAAATLAACGAAWGQAPGAATPTTTTPKEAPPPTYIKVNLEELSRTPAQYSGRFVQLADIFGTMVERFPGDLARLNVAPQTHFAFRTHRALGSNMLCVASRENKEAQAFFETPLTAETEIYIMGKVGPVVDAGDAVVPLCFVDRIVRGTTPPPAVKVEKKKPATLTIEKVVSGNYVKVKDYQIPEAGKRYVIEDPYDPTKKIYVTIQY
jgi:hypothetical protein